MRYTILDQTGLVINVEEWDFTPPKEAILSDIGNIGDTWDGTKFVVPKNEY